MMIKQFHQPLGDAALDQLFREARTYNDWLDQPVTDAQLHAIWDLAKMGPTSANMLPARIVWVKSDEPKQTLASLAGGTNPGKILAAPVTAIMARSPPAGRNRIASPWPTSSIRISRPGAGNPGRSAPARPASAPAASRKPATAPAPQALTLAPNPGRTPMLAGAHAGAGVQVFDAVGRLVFSTTADARGAARLRLPAALAPGVYLVRSGRQAVRLAVD